MDKIKIAQLSNSFATGNGGGNFERHVQAVFLLALLVDGFSPILERPIARLDFQGKRLGYDTDDLIVTSVGLDAPKMLCQIKHDISSKIFQEVINAAWSDFNKDFFRIGKDKILLVTGIIAKNTISSLRYIYDQAIIASGEDDFFSRIEQSNYTSAKVRDKFALLKSALTSANDGVAPTDYAVWCFCKSFVLLIFDMDYQSSLNETLVQSLITTQSSADAKSVWAELSDLAGDFNQSAGSICLNNIPDEIKAFFDTARLRQTSKIISNQFVPTELWATLSIIGIWNEKKDHDVKIVEQLTGLTSDALGTHLRQLMIEKSPYVTHRDGIWKIQNRESLVYACKGCFFDRMVERAFNLATEMLKQKNLRFDENNEFSIMVPETGSFQSSESLRKGLIQGLCMLSSDSASFTACSKNTIKTCSFKLIRDVFTDCDWIKFSSLYDVLPLVAEISPKQYLDSLEEYILQPNAELANLFPKKEASPLFSQSFINGIIWSIEVLAWDEQYLVACVRCLAELAAASCTDRDASEIVLNAIKDILLPWHPQTMASVDRQKNAVHTLQVELPDIGWAVIKSLLPSDRSMTGGTQKPKYLIRNIPKEMSVARKTVDELYRYYASIAVALAAGSASKMEDLTEYIDYFDGETIEQYLLGISAVVPQWSDEEKFPLWNKLSDLKFRILMSNQGVASDTTPYKHLCSTIELMAPQENHVLYRRLYLSNYDADMLHEEDGFTAKWDEKEKEKRTAILDLYTRYGLEAVEQFGLHVKNLHDVGYKLGQTLPTADMKNVIQKGYTKAITDTFLHATLQGHAIALGADTLLCVDLQNYSPEFISDVLSQIYISHDLIDVVHQLLPNNEMLFWNTIRLPVGIGAGGGLDLLYIVDRLLEAHRAVAAINLCGRTRRNPLVPDEKIAEMLKMAATTESPETLDSYAFHSLIKRLQATKQLGIEELSEIEFIYLPWLNKTSSAYPRALYYKIANDPSYFCEMLQLAYKKRHEVAQTTDPSHIAPELLKRLSQILFKFCVIPGTDWDGNFHEDIFTSWLDEVKTWARDNDRYEVAVRIVGNGLSYASTDDDGIICELAIIKVLNAADAKEIRKGYHMGLFNQRGVHFVDPEGKAERIMAEKYTRGADKVEHQGYSRYSELLREIASSYIAEAEQNALEDKLDSEEEYS